MSPELPSHTEESETPTQPEGRFGDEEAIIEVMRTHELKILGKIEDLVPGIANHVNAVEIAEAGIDPPEIDEAGKDSKKTFANELDVVEVEGEGEQKLWCIFKPQDGESEEVKNKFGFKDFYSHEHAAYLISKHFGFEIVPPTVVRTIDGRLWALQLFLRPEEYRTAASLDISLEESDYDLIMKSPDIMEMQLLDYIIGNVDRHQDNYLYRITVDDDQKPKLYLDDNGQPQIVGIDHGNCLNDYYYRYAEKYVPHEFLTFSNIDDKPLKTPVPENMLDALEKGMEGIEGLLSELKNQYPGFNENDLGGIKTRAEKVLKHRHFLSGRNIGLFEKFTGSNWFFL